jgi:protein TonB
MPITEFDLYKSGWLELVFDDRNKAYGAYDLRKHYAENLFKALGFTTLGFVCLLLGFNFILTHQPEQKTGVVVTMTPRLITPPDQKKPVDPPKPKITPPQVQTVKYVRMTPTVDQLAKNPPTIEDLKVSAVGTVDQKGKIDPNANLGITDAGSGDGLKAETEEQPQPFGTVEINPEFPGGETAWAKFMQKNLRYPNQAVEAGVSGKVFVSFVVEKDGHLSDIKVIRGVGYGLDEEAIRVLKLAPAWKPGIQNGRPVRVMYTMPFSFQLPDNN